MEKDYVMSKHIIVLLLEEFRNFEIYSFKKQYKQDEQACFNLTRKFRRKNFSGPQF